MAVLEAMLEHMNSMSHHACLVPLNTKFGLVMLWKGILGIALRLVHVCLAWSS